MKKDLVIKRKEAYKVGIDCDGVLRDFDTCVLALIQEIYPGKVPDNYAHTCWDYTDIDIPSSELSKLWKETHCEQIYRESPLMPGVKEELKLLKEWARTQRPGFKFSCVTSQMPYNVNHTLYWLGKNYFNFMEVIVSNNKHKFNIDYLIDDSPRNYEKWVASGRDEKEYILFDRPYNQHIEATNRIYKLSDAIEILKK
jgi:5'(3')-deoxyribonucleotidase